MPRPPVRRVDGCRGWHYTRAPPQRKETVHPNSLSFARARPLLAWALLGGIAPAVHALDLGKDFTAGGNLAITSDYIYRGVSQSNDHAALQGDLHLDSGRGTFVGVWASTRSSDLEPGARYDLEVYLGQRFNLSSAWNATLSVRSHYYAGGVGESSDDYQEILGTLTYLDRWSISLTAIPNAVRYWFYRRLTRSPAWVADSSGQWLIAGGLFATAGVGYYSSQGTGTGIERATGYAYGNGGLAYEWRSLRLDVGYFVTQHSAERTYPYPIANRLAGTLSWRF